MIDRSKYFDHNATTPLIPAARDAWLSMADHHWENPSSLYREAGEARQQLEGLRVEMSGFLEIDDPERVVFNSGATESNNWVIRHMSQAPGKIGVSAVEHPCVRAAAAGFFGPDRMIEIGVDPITGIINLEEVEQLTQSGEMALISVMAANNETGTIQPWDAITELCCETGVPYHCDSAQWFGKEPPGLFNDVDYFTGSAHKFGGPKGVGFLVLPEDFEQCDFIGQLGGPQENGRRGGTENLPGIAAMAAAFRERGQTYPSSEPRDAFERALEDNGNFKIVGKRGPRLANTSMIILPHTKNTKWLTRLSQRGFGVSTGSACSAGAGNPSQVMMAMDVEFEEMGRVLRISGGPENDDEAWQALLAALLEVATELV